MGKTIRTGEKSSANRHKKRGAIGEMAPPRKEMKQGRRQCRLGEDTNLLQAGGLARETSFEGSLQLPCPKEPTDSLHGTCQIGLTLIQEY